MSVAYYVVLDNDDPGFEMFVNGKAFAHAIEELDTICAQENLTKFDQFMGQSMDELSDMLGDDLELPDGETSRRMQASRRSGQSATSNGPGN